MTPDFNQSRIKLSSLHGSASFLDPAASKTKVKRTAANQAIVTVANYDRWIFVLEAWSGRISTDKLHDRIIHVVSTFRPRRFGCEANAMQSLFADDINLVAKLKGVRLNVEPVFVPTNVDKEQRIRQILQPIINYGRLFLGPGQERLVEELTTFPHGRTRDLVDALASAIEMLPLRSSDQNLSETEESLRAFLAKVHTNPKLMERRIQQWRETRARRAA